MEQSLKTAHVSLLKVIVKSFSPMDNMAVLGIFYESNKSKQITRTTKLGDANVLALQLMNELIISEKNNVLEFDGESLIDVEVVVENEQKTRAMLIDFFRTLHSKAQKIKNNKSSSGYLDLIRNLQRTELRLYDQQD
ncbi:hypothetical protein CMO88_01445 [Candidatus Woesearchaeota archaeon]|nr:hypothetical protein [Candidatus Woesearchaeota archaeon]|tara:strand:- start:35111 stop:35521 length:411 start_codon:yes stop_codon:yes gene_type:complete